MVPGLRAFRENVHCRHEPCGIGETAGLKAEHIWHAPNLHCDLTSAIRAEASFNRLSAAANTGMITKLAVQPHSLFRKNDQWSICAAAGLLAITAVTVEHEHRVDGCLITNGPAGASA